MILEVEVENLFSFKDKITFDMDSNIVNIMVLVIVGKLIS